MEASVWKRKVNLLLLGIPLIVASQQGLLHLGDATLPLTFVLSALSLIPLAGFLESAVEELAELLGEFIGGLLHTTSTNIAELAIGLSLLLSFAGSGGSEIVLGSIAGVIIRNSLLFLGLATFFGALRNGKMYFNAKTAGEYSTVFALAVIGLSLPTLAHFIFAANGASEGAAGAGDFLVLGRYPLSLALAYVLLVIYIAYVLFVVFHVQSGEKPKKARGRLAVIAEQIPTLRPQPDTQALFPEERERAEEKLAEEAGGRSGHARAKYAAEKRRARAERGETHFLEGHRVARGLLAVLILALATAGVAAMSEAFAHSVEALISQNEGLKQYEFFLGLVLIPVLAGMVELYGTVGMARRNKMVITMEVTAGATIQMILLVVPVLVIVGALTGHALDLVFKPLAVIVLAAATFAFMLLSRDGESTLMEGVQLCAIWLLLAVVAIFLYPG